MLILSFNLYNGLNTPVHIFCRDLDDIHNILQVDDGIYIYAIHFVLCLFAICCCAFLSCNSTGKRYLPQPMHSVIQKSYVSDPFTIVLPENVKQCIGDGNTTYFGEKWAFFDIWKLDIWNTCKLCLAFVGGWSTCLNMQIVVCVILGMVLKGYIL